MLSSISYWTLRNKYSPPLQRCRTAEDAALRDAAQLANEPTVPSAETTPPEGESTGRDGQQGKY